MTSTNRPRSSRSSSSRSRAARAPRQRAPRQSTAAPARSGRRPRGGAGSSALARAAELRAQERPGHARAGLIAGLGCALLVVVVLVGVAGLGLGAGLGVGAVVGAVLGAAVYLRRARGASVASSPSARYAVGARTEARTARVLDRHGPRHGWAWHHDRALPGSDANADHVGVHASGVLVNLDSKWRDPASRVVWNRRAGTLAVGKWSADDLTRAALGESAVIARALGVDVVTVVVIDGARIPRAQVGAVDPITVENSRFPGQRVVILGIDDVSGWLHRSADSPVWAALLPWRRPARAQLATALDAAIPALLPPR